MKEQEEYNNFLKNSLNLKNIREERRKEISKDALFKSCKKKIQTTMIGALDIIEKNFGFLWRFDENSELTPEQKHMKDIYEDARAKILDKGNTQIRNLESEFCGYEISKKRYQISLPVVGNNNSTQGEKNDGQE
jgi:transcription termination factor Rho